MKQAIGKMLVDHRGFDFTKRILGPDGKIRYIRCVGVPVTHGATFQGFVGTGMDVTEQEQLTKALRKSEEELRQVLDLTPQLIAATFILMTKSGATFFLIVLSLVPLLTSWSCGCEGVMEVIAGS